MSNTPGLGQGYDARRTQFHFLVPYDDFKKYCVYIPSENESEPPYEVRAKRNVFTLANRRKLIQKKNIIGSI